MCVHCIKNNKLYVINILFRYRREIKSFEVRRGFIFRKDRIFNCMLHTLSKYVTKEETRRWYPAGGCHPHVI